MNLDNIKTVDICFENCDGFSVGIEDIKYLYITRITENVFITDHFRSTTKISERTSIIINKNVNSTVPLWFDRGELPFERTLQHRDIVSIGFTYLDGTQEEIYVNWNGEDDYSNPMQKAEINDNGDLVI
ncbi:hypothetical protein D7X33_22415, partial [Butyricicoccus sp. 1XD8-22]